ncbi:hypothetical protein WJX84_000295 [Apatococcus fuscideae]|uniref:Endopeptidase S2P n=1 Tax=Apatococcus fuscideae TaxID=2026836 RepID=A0AAW1T4C2_9CHLO
MLGYLWYLLILWGFLYLAVLAIKLLTGLKLLSLGWCSISIRTTALNRLFYQAGRHQQVLLRQWFSMGVLVAAMLATSALFIMAREIMQTVQWAVVVARDDRMVNVPIPGTLTDGRSQGWGMALWLPGYTVPWSHAVFLWLATCISVSVHEAGHALAAASEGVGVHYVAAFSLLLLPGAYVALDGDTLAVLGPWRTLRVVCAGVWHNAVLCVVCWMTALLLPWLLLPLYSSGHGAVVRVMPETSPLTGHMAPLDAITSVDQCPVSSAEDWRSCLKSSHLHNGYDLAMPGMTIGGQQTTRGLESALSLTPPLQGYCVPVSQALQGHACRAERPAVSATAACGGSKLCWVASDDAGASMLRDESNAAKTSSSGSSWPQLGGKVTSREAIARSLEGLKSSARDQAKGQWGARRLEEGGSGMPGVCLGARLAAAHQPCWQGLVDVCPESSLCMLPLLPPKEALSKICYRRGPHHDDPDIEATESSLATGLGGRRQLQARHLNASHAPQDSTPLWYPFRPLTNGPPGGDAMFTVEDDRADPWHSTAGVAESTGSASRASAADSEARASLQQQSGQGAEKHLLQDNAASRDEGEIGQAEGYWSSDCRDYHVFLGGKESLLASLDTTDYLPLVWMLPLGLPRSCELLLAYTFAVSAGIALINMAPVFWLDGEAALAAALDCGSHLPRVDALRAQSRGYWLRRLLQRWLLFIGTIMLLLVLFIQYLRIGGYDTPLCNLFHRIHHLIEFLRS